ncbi:hypothetical protein DXB59_14755 [Ruminococcus sp. OM05-10BH]|uniref:5-bromo-4-chloroindolyl phosphate hydrolysis family protein n=1 Tax=Drancourtella sp. An12 TaxID=1965548 RepID=UPI000B38A0F2|nr:5-bromo-4-chloroindolyl phosphate hydrolysis family protein [Drancourtella sp. An12]OUQ43058.1 hypothetical protein B5E64_15445 [Drancourtella sp. An12]RHV31575.1 hypothetical protein DXB59_14755 [Ruminococcus sp. OM05-10BH]
MDVGQIIFIGICVVGIFIASVFCLDSCGFVERLRMAHMIKTGRKRIRRLGSLREKLPDAVWREQLKKLEESAEAILDTAVQSPQALEIVERLVEDFLPALTELVESYGGLDRRTLFGDEIRAVNRGIEDVLTRMQAVFEDMLDRLNRKPVTDFSKQVNFVNRMMDRAGLPEADPARETDGAQRQSSHAEPSGKEEI